MMFGQRSVSEAYPSIKSQPMTTISRTTSNSSSNRFRRSITTITTINMITTGQSRSTLKTKASSGETAGCVAGDLQAPRIRSNHVNHVNHVNLANTGRTSNPPDNRSSRSP
jgi:hypothetical protein